MAVHLDPDLRCRDGRLVQLLDWWQKFCKIHTRLPARADFDPLQMTSLLPNVYMADVIDGGRRFRWRLIGSDVIAMAGRNATGRFFDELYKGEEYLNFTASFTAVAAEMRPMRSLGSFSFADRSFIHFEALEVPLTQDGAAVDVIIGIAAKYLG